MDDLIVGADGRPRCGWCGTDPLYVAYHDDEWGRPVHDDQRLFEKLCLEGFQAGLAWITILRKRPAFRAAFADFAIDVVAEMGDDDVERLLGDAAIVRHRGKITAAIGNARRAQELIAEAGSLDAHLWSFAPEGRARPRSFAEMAATTPESTALSKDLKKRGWRFVGPTTVYAFMQAMGIVDDHIDGCWVPER
ncbi:DNA-3-methyladenine glycosylase I [Iamia sp. SCSIO 61187]|uniref:DNA-3-methyladenine glycosylase I n=1 Tax=Iamia sp. SCSIO 61187 TaxID=2722752 RepID=UPI00272A75F6|nr:DNA-3-methyladenine glycosylase I [Iamia sp. SCSIO 61187]QYG91345.1 DNA-3-methyladenine glycosylase I [Iamia sp. SCSIO 61187]